MKLFVGGFLLIANSDRVNPQKVHYREFLISVTLFFPQICSQSLVLTHGSMHATSGHLDVQGWNPRVTVDSPLFLHPDTHSIVKPHLFTFVHLLCPVLVQQPTSLTKAPATGPLLLLLASCSLFSVSQPEQSLQNQSLGFLPLTLFPAQHQLSWLFSPGSASPSSYMANSSFSLEYST